MKSIKLMMMATLTILSFSVFAQDSSKSKMKMDHHMKDSVIYTCTMDPDVVSDKPGKCPKCGMDLVQKKIKIEAKRVYTCTMHPDVKTDKPGKCPKCGMDLVEKKPAKTKTTK
jgi:hypothetical protein